MSIVFIVNVTLCSFTSSIVNIVKNLTLKQGHSLMISCQENA